MDSKAASIPGTKVGKGDMDVEKENGNGALRSFRFADLIIIILIVANAIIFGVRLEAQVKSNGKELSRLDRDFTNHVASEGHYQTGVDIGILKERTTALQREMEKK